MSLLSRFSPQPRLLTLSLASVFLGLLSTPPAFAGNPDITHEGGRVTYNRGRNDAANIAVGHGAEVFVGSGNMEALISFGHPVHCATGFLGICFKYDVTDPSTLAALPDGMAIGSNTYSRTGSIDIGARTLGDRTLGDAENVGSMGRYSVAETTVGTNSYTNGPFATTFGSYNIQSSPYRENLATTGEILNYAPRNAFATVIGSFNSNESMTEDKNYSGIGNYIGGVANSVNSSNGTIVIGAGNKVTNSLSSLSGISGMFLGSKYDHPKDLQDAMQRALRDEGGGATLTLGGGNQLDWAQFSQVFGVKNTLTGTAESVSQYNSVSGASNTVTGSSHTFVSGVSNTVTNTTGAVLLGDKRTFTGANNSVAVGFATSPLTTNVANAAILGTDANVTTEGGVALGYQSVASRAAGQAGYDPSTQEVSTDASSVWTSTLAAVSVGDTGKTRQITGVAAGTEDTDAVNVAQLKALAAAINGSGDADRGTGGAATTFSANGGNETTLNGSAPQNLKVTETTNAAGGNHYDVKLADKVQLGSDTTSNQVTVDGNSSFVSLGVAGPTQIVFDGAAGKARVGEHIAFDATTEKANVGKVAIDGKAGSVGGLSNTAWDPENIVSGRAATEDQVLAASQAQRRDYQRLHNDIRELSKDIKNTGAASAALAGLKAIQYDPDKPTQFAAAIGGYRGKYALSVGLGHYSSNSVFWHAGVAVNEHPMFNLGVTFKFGGKSDDEKKAIAERKVLWARHMEKFSPAQAKLNAETEAELGRLQDENQHLAKELKSVREELAAFKALVEKKLKL